MAAVACVNLQFIPGTDRVNCVKTPLHPHLGIPRISEWTKGGQTGVVRASTTPIKCRAGRFSPLFLLVQQGLCYPRTGAGLRHLNLGSKINAAP